MARNEISLTIRLPKKLHAEIKRAAKIANRSANAEIVTALQEWVRMAR